MKYVKDTLVFDNQKKETMFMCLICGFAQIVVSQLLTGECHGELFLH
jgi:hypothetical protein